MKQTFLFCFITAISVFFSCTSNNSTSADTPSPKEDVVIETATGNVVGSLVSINDSTFTISVQDEVDVPKQGHSIVTYSADKAQGFLTANDVNEHFIFAQPSTSSAVVAKVQNEPQMIPEVLPCLGFDGKFYLTEFNGTKGYVIADEFTWSALNCY